MKKIYLLSMLCVALILASCSSKDDVIEYVPLDANIVVKVEAKTILEKIGFKFEGEKLISNSADLSNLLSQLDLPSDALLESGINFDKEMATFLFSQKFEVGIIANLNDSNKLKALVEKNVAKTSTDQGINYVIKDNIIVGFTDNMMFIGSSNGKSDEKELIRNTSILLNRSGKSIKENKDAMKILEEDKDLACYINSEGLWSNETLSKFPMLSSNPLLMMMQGMMKDAYKYQSITFDFNKDNIEIDSKAVVNKQNKYIQAFNSIFIPNKDAEFLKFFPADVNCIYSFSIDGSKIVELPEYKNFISQLGFFGPSIKDMASQAISTIKGPLAIGIKGSASDNTAPMYVAVKSTNPEKIIELIKAIAPMGLSHVTSNGKGGYILDISNVKIEFGSQNGYFYAKTISDPLTTTAFDNKEIQNICKGSMFGVYASSGAENSVIANSIREVCGMSLLGTFTVKSNSIESSETKITITKPINNNILETIIQVITSMRKTSLRNQATSESSNVDPYSYTPGEPLEDIYGK